MNVTFLIPQYDDEERPSPNLEDSRWVEHVPAQNETVTIWNDEDEPLCERTRTL